jgi:hypothetical protein
MAYRSLDTIEAESKNCPFRVSSRIGSKNIETTSDNTGTLLRLWVRIPPGEWMSVCCECCVLSGRGLCDELITRPEESYRLWCVVVCDLEISIMRRSWPTRSCRAKNQQTHKETNKPGGRENNHWAWKCLLTYSMEQSPPWEANSKHCS